MGVARPGVIGVRSPGPIGSLRAETLNRAAALSSAAFEAAASAGEVR